MVTYQITYTVPGYEPLTSGGHTKIGKRSLLTAVLRAGGTGFAVPEKTQD